MSRFRILTVAIAALAGTAAVTVLPLASSAAGAALPAPHIVARPDRVMVNTQTHLTGRSFAPGATLHLVECSQTAWIAPQDPCDTTNAKTVTTNSHGGFRTPFTVETCPGPITPPGFSEICYIGVPVIGLDSTVLEGAAKITVTGP